MNTCYDPDIDTFLNLDQLTYTSPEPTRTKSELASHPSVSSTDYSANELRSASFASSSQSPLAFQGPSHQYDEHKQQTGLPPGALAHAMAFNANEMGFGAGNQTYPLNGDMVASHQLQRDGSGLDFGRTPTRNPSEMDLESDNVPAVPTYYFTPNPNRGQFVDPSALNGQEAVNIGPSTQVGRMYPGMHQQQAAMARAAAQQQRHHEFLRQQQLFQQQQQQQQQQQHQRIEQHLTQSRPLRHPDPEIEERITRLLQQMKRTPVTPESTPGPSSILPQLAKIRKEEQDMDEDERLLASEEGKKLSSKERRQLRNKVSARAFRSRRKEYITQLESEVTAKTTEAHDLRLRNRALQEENGRLTDLVRLLLSSPQFSTFLDELSVSGLPPPPSTTSQAPQVQPRLPQQQEPHPPTVARQPVQTEATKDVNTNLNSQEIQMQQNAQVGMVIVPSHQVEMSSVDMTTAGWNSGIDMNYGNTPIFAVLDVPQGPAVDTEVLSGKSLDFAGSYSIETKEEVPCLELPPVVEESNGDSGMSSADSGIDIDESDPAFALFMDSPASPASAPSDPFGGPFNNVHFEKGCVSFQLVVGEDPEDLARAAATSHFVRLCHSMEAAFQRVSMVTSHLS
ncbi:hypothetical protein MPDQ_005593 [Monascus purpureus]|uniref:BZIP domain-containing protein n=1 Tax=Monascus purpureus TaxID=5098 RepID=A0A507R6X5_MONPU|nr:hypothetical protein MPDQ_005593 [Monascus purpureus]